MSGARSITDTLNVIGQQIHALELLGVLAPALDRTFSTLSDPTRRAILERLGRGPATMSELAHPFGISLPGLLKHVRILEQRTW